MTGNEQSPAHQSVLRARFVDHSLSQLCDAVADPDHRSGGGAIAALSIAGSAAIIELVLSLATRRKALAERRPEIATQLEQVNAVRQRLITLIDRDLDAFDRVMQVQAELKTADDDDKEMVRERLAQAFLEATSVPVDVAQIGLDLLTSLQDALPVATRFTVSDLGSAATIINGAIEAALLTADINLNYVPAEQRSALEDQVTSIRAQAPALSAEVLEATKARIQAKGKGQ